MRFIITISLILLTQIGFAQDPQLFENPWHIQKVHIDGVDYFPPYPEFNGEAMFTNDTLFVFHWNCQEGFGTMIDYVNTDEFNIDDASVILLGTCNDPSEWLFMEKHYSLYLLDNLFAKNPFTYSITTGSSGLSLTVTNGDGDYGIYGDQLLSSGDFSESSVTIYPNPVNDILYLENVNNLLIKAITIYDITGRVVLEETGNVSQIDVTNLTIGLLLIKINTENGILNTKIIKK